jgi:hypothetical protein
MARNMEEELPDASLTCPSGPTLHVSAFVAAGRGPHDGRGHTSSGGRGGRGLPNKCIG